jgi:hypothetical protein
VERSAAFTTADYTSSATVSGLASRLRHRAAIAVVVTRGMEAVMSTATQKLTVIAAIGIVVASVMALAIIRGSSTVDTPRAIVAALPETGGPRSRTPIDTRADDTAVIRTRLAEIDSALATRELDGTGEAWMDAFRAARATQSWPLLIEVGDAARRLAIVSGSRRYMQHARESYLAAHVFARRIDSAEGTRRASDGFARLGDHAVAEELRRAAERIAARGVH